MAMGAGYCSLCAIWIASYNSLIIKLWMPIVRREPDFFGDQELVLIFAARRLRDAIAVEQIFDDGGVDYVLETAPYESGLVFRSTKIGVFFYIPSQESGRASELLGNRGYKSYDADHRSLYP